MLIGFGVLIWIPAAVTRPHDHIVLAANAVNLALVGATWLVADSIVRAAKLRREPTLTVSPAA
jgi:hypothetical protein